MQNKYNMFLALYNKKTKLIKNLSSKVCYCKQKQTLKTKGELQFKLWLILIKVNLA